MRRILGIFDPPRSHWAGDGFPVRSLFSYRSHGEQVSPFLLMDYAGPQVFAPATRPRGVGLHPHRGFETVTIVYQGEVAHRDSTGASGTIGPGDVQWMTAGSGILHEEFHSPAFTGTGGTLEMVQLWVNLPARDKMTAPRYQTLLSRDIPVVNLPGGAGTVRVIAGIHDGLQGPAKTFTPMGIWDVRVTARRSAAFTLPEGHTLAAAVLEGHIVVNGTETAREAQIAVFGRTGGSVTMETQGGARLLILSGEPINEPVVGRGPFVMNTADEIAQAFLDFQTGRLGGTAP